MRPEYRFELRISIFYDAGCEDQTCVNANVRVHNETGHFATVNLLRCAHPPDPELNEMPTVEQFANHAARLAARLIDEDFYERLKKGECINEHTLDMLSGSRPIG